MVGLRQDEHHPVGQVVGVGQFVESGLLGTAVDAAGPTHHDEASVGAVQLGKGADGHVDALERLDASGEEQDGTLPEAGGPAGHRLRSG